ncbi:helix-turn-helix transcriptional regulator [Chengkuizengella axinellae]|uniref:LuxR C-terminal-related transcriptional regulator n=1 Tax=Chengkuizengella axinellae TaxID=3064388 RepID=A0ABT9J3A3_9BACL|nr:LuxR C-terminal-related transcriptional regulator [Chengkuizengella sp. 2205SS18-9]MDP5276099.1 LuxR C-terminal-related transcriptional regulator [Chengkuizengella sp. 2205SS18-9]
MNTQSIELTANKLQEEYHLTQREKQVLILLIKKGYNNQRIGEKLYISEKTVKNHFRSIYLKMSIHSARELYTIFISNICYVLNLTNEEKTVKDKIDVIDIITELKEKLSEVESSVVKMNA